MPMQRRKDSKNRVLREGESERKNGTYEYKYRDLFGKRKSVYAKVLDELREKEKVINRDLEDGIMSNDLTVYQLAEKYLSQKKQLKPNTMQGYKCALDRIKRNPIANVKIDKLKMMDAKAFFRRLQEVDGLGYSSIAEVKKLVKPAFELAIENDLIRKNPFDFKFSDVVINDTKKREALTEKQMQDFLQFVKNNKCYKKYYDEIYILFHTGLRISEFCGLTRKDVDLKERTIDVNHQLHKTGSEFYIETTKTDAGNRVIPIDEETYQCLERKMKDKPSVESIVDSYSGFIFLTRNGSLTDKYIWNHRFDNIVKAYNKANAIQMPNVTPHICRHTFCSNMARAGMNPKTLQYIMGHSSIGVTMDVYTHLGLEDARKEMWKIKEAAI